MASDIDRFVLNFVRDIESGTAAVFAGAGLSASAGFVNWVELLRPLAEAIGLSAEKEQSNLVSLAQFHLNENGGNRSEINQRLLFEFPSHATPSLNHQLLARLPISVYWTTNYDKLIETAISAAGKVVDVKHQVSQLSFTKPGRDVVVFKMHGDVDSPNEAVLVKDDYECYHSDRAAFITALSGDLVSKTFLFLGFSFSDPNLDFVLSSIRLHLGNSKRKHYTLMRRVSRKDFSDEVEFTYASVRQGISIRDLRRYNIEAVLFDEYHEITDVIRRIDHEIRKTSVFISGSAEDFNGWDRKDVEDFLVALGQVLTARGFRICSGFGQGISDSLLSGAIGQFYSDRHDQFDRRFSIRPFPRHVEDDQERKLLWSKHRSQLIADAGIAIFLFGNKREGESGVVVPADGMVEEFEMARTAGLALIPIGATGYVAETLASRIQSATSAVSDERIELFKMLQERPEKPIQLIEPLIKYLTGLD